MPVLGSLLDQAMEDCHIMDKTTQPDGYGGVVTTYVAGAEIKAAFAFELRFHREGEELLIGFHLQHRRIVISKMIIGSLP